MIFDAAVVDDNPTRWTLMALSALADNAQFTSLLKESVEALHWSQDERGCTLTFVMPENRAAEMRRLLPRLFGKLKKGIELDGGITLFNLRACPREAL